LGGECVEAQKSNTLLNQKRRNYLGLIFAMIVLIQFAASQDRSVLPIITINLEDNIDVPSSLDIEGNISKELPSGTYMWLIVSRNSNPQMGRPQCRIEPWNGTWNAQAIFSGPNEKFDVIVILVNRTDDQYFDKHKGNEVLIPEKPISSFSKTVNLMPN